MAKASINFQKATRHSRFHNFREDEPSYLLPREHRKENEYWELDKTDEQIFKEEFARAKRKGGRIPKLESSRWEAALNLNAKHTMKDVKKVAKHIEEKFNIVATQIAIHRDEGHINERDIAEHNLHAHINFVTYKDGRQNWRKEHIKPNNLSELQTEIAEMLDMDRGEKGSKTQRLEHRQFKAVKQRELAQQKDLKAEIAQLREQLKEQQATREDYAKLEQLNRELKEQVRKKDLKLETMQEKFEALQKELKINSNESELFQEPIISKRLREIRAHKKEVILEFAKKHIKEEIVVTEQKIFTDKRETKRVMSLDDVAKLIKKMHEQDEMNEEMIYHNIKTKREKELEDRIDKYQRQNIQLKEENFNYKKQLGDIAEQIQEMFGYKIDMLSNIYKQIKSFISHIKDKYQVEKEPKEQSKKKQQDISRSR